MRIRTPCAMLLLLAGAAEASAASSSKPISFGEAAGWLTPPTLLAFAATEKGMASHRARELNPLFRTTGARAAAQLLQVGVASLVVHEVSKRNRSAGRWTLRVFVGYKWIEAGWDVHVAFSSGKPRR